MYNLFTDNLNWLLHTDKLLWWDKLWLTEVIQDNSRWLFRQDWLYYCTNCHVVENYVIERIKSYLAKALYRVKTILLIEWQEFQKLKMADIKQKILFIFTNLFFLGVIWTIQIKFIESHFITDRHIFISF